jgi:hypothetical protein
MPKRRAEPAPRSHGWSLRSGDASLTVLLVAQAVISFIAIPLAAAHPAARSLLDLSHLVFAAVCAIALTGRRAPAQPAHQADLALTANVFAACRVRCRVAERRSPMPKPAQPIELVCTRT